MTNSKTTRRQHIRQTGAALTAIGGGGLVATHSGSASGDSTGILADGFEVERDIRAFARGMAGMYSADSIGPPDDVGTLADRARNEFNANADEWVSYGNFLLDGAGVSGSGDTMVGVTFEITRGYWPTRSESTETAIDVGYDESTDEFTELDWLDDSPDSPEFELTLKNRAAVHASDELSAFRREWIGDSVDEHEQPSDEYLNTLAGEYWASIGFGSDSKTVLEVLLGEVDVDG